MVSRTSVLPSSSHCSTAPPATYDGIGRVMSWGFGGWYRRRVLQRAGLRPGMRLLDLAVGTGAVAREAIALGVASEDIVGLDVSAGMLEQARRQLPIALLRGRMETLPLTDDSVDMVTMGYALRHVADLRAAFAECLRVLRPGGRVVLLELAGVDAAASLDRTLLPRPADSAPGAADQRERRHRNIDAVLLGHHR
ncbi:MAG: class I SAM-dependent methyltransferase [Rhodospirillales bacterium]|nr:class I SAM-dependent methyltransferase [Rhodospirillales bacterium]